RGTTGVLAVTADLPAGHVLAAPDLAVRQVKLPGLGAYLGADQRAAVVGQVLRRAVGAGELLPRAAVGPADAGPTAQLVALEVSDARHPALRAGDLVDVF